MREIVVAVNSQDKINLGYLGENNYQVVKFDITDWLREHENGKAVLLFKVNGMDDPYPCKVEIQGNYANWILTKADLQQGRNGKCQLIYYADGEAIAKSSIFCTDVANSLGEQTTEPPEAFTSWVNDVLIAGSQAENGVKSAVQIQQQMNETLLSAQQTFEAAVRQGLSSIEDAKEQVAQQAEQSIGRLDETADAANKTVLDALTEGLHHIDTAQTQAVQAVIEEGNRQVERLSTFVPDGYYTKEESDTRYAQIDDAKSLQTTTWSSENIVSKFCTPFEVSGSIVICNPIEGSQLNMLAQIEPVQQGEGTPSTENVRPIHGWDSVTICRGGKNLWGGRLFKAEYTSGIPHITKYEDITFPYSPAYSTQGLAVILPVSAYETFTFKAHEANENATYRYAIYVDFESAYNYKNKLESKTVLSNTSFTVSSSGIMVFIIGGTWTLDNDKIHVFTEEEKFQLELGDTSTAYESYRGETFTIPTSEMVYGGTLDVGSGVLTKTHQNIPSYAGEDVGDEWISSTGSLTDGAQVVYQLPQPEIIQLDLQEIYALSGINTICVDSGNVTVSGYSDPKTVINTLTKRIAALEQNAIGGRYL